MKNNYVLGIPPSGSWQDLRDHMREAGDVCYADVSRDGTGVVEFMNRDDMKFAIRHLDDTKFRSHEVGYLIITVCVAYNNIHQFAIANFSMMSLNTYLLFNFGI